MAGIGFAREIKDPLSTVTSAERCEVVAMLLKQVHKDNNLAGLLFEKFESHRKLMRYEQRVVDQLRKKSHIKK